MLSTVAILAPSDALWLFVATRCVRKSRPLRRRPLVVVNDPSKNVHPMDGAGSRCLWEWHGALLAETLMGPPLIEEGHIFPQHPVQMALPEDQQVVQALRPC